MRLQRHKKPRIVFNFLIVFFLSVSLITIPLRAESNNSISSYTKLVFNNGLTIIVKEIHTTPIVAVNIWVNTGSKNDPPSQEGLSHFLEHMLFKGTTKQKVGEIAKAINGVGGYLNAFTSFDTTHYIAIVPSENIDLALEVESDAIMNSIFDPQEIEKEQKVILEEISLGKDRDFRNSYQAAYPDLLEGTPYGHLITGTSESLAKINREAFIDYYHKYYVPNNMVIVVVGDVNTEQINKSVETLFKDFQFKKLPPAKEFLFPKSKKINRFESVDSVEKTYISMEFLIPGHIKEDIPKLTLLAKALRPRIYKSLGNKIPITSVSTYYEIMHEAGIFSINIRAKVNDPKVLEKAICNAINWITNNGIMESDLKLVKNWVISDFSYETETNEDIASFIGNWILDGTWDTEEEYLNAIKNVKKDEISAISKKYLKLNNYIVTITKPLEAKK